MLENLQPIHPHASSGSDALLQRHRLAEQFPNHLSTRHCRTWSETVESEELRKETMDGHHGGLMLLVSKPWMEYFGMTWTLLRPALVASCAMQRIWAQSAILSCLQRQTSVNYHELSSFGIWGRGILWTRPSRVRNDCRITEWMILWASSLAPSAKLRIWELAAWTGSRNPSPPTLSSILLDACTFCKWLKRAMQCGRRGCAKMQEKCRFCGLRGEDHAEYVWSVYLSILTILRFTCSRCTSKTFSFWLQVSCWMERCMRGWGFQVQMCRVVRAILAAIYLDLGLP